MCPEIVALLYRLLATYLMKDPLLYAWGPNLSHPMLLLSLFSNQYNGHIATGFANTRQLTSGLRGVIGLLMSRTCELPTRNRCGIESQLISY